MPCLEISAPLTLMWLFGRLFMDIIVSVTVLGNRLYYLRQACQQYISIAIYLFIAINIFIIALFSILQYIIAAKKLQYYCNILQKYVTSVRVYIEI